MLFIHGFCSSADTWNETLPQLSTRRYGDDVPRVYESASGKAGARTPVSPGATTFRIDFSDLANGFDLLAVANVPTVRKAGELKVVIDAIKRFTGAPKVILVGHSLGGLAARAYIQGIGRNRNGGTIAYGGDVAALIMISTPNQGSVLANLSGRPEAQACTLADTANLRDLQPDVSLADRAQSPAVAGGHARCTRSSRTMPAATATTWSPPPARTSRRFLSTSVLPDVKRWLQAFERDGVLHLRVHNEPTTVALFTGIVGDIDNRSGLALTASPFSMQRITWRGIPLGDVDVLDQRSHSSRRPVAAATVAPGEASAARSWTPR